MKLKITKRESFEKFLIEKNIPKGYLNEEQKKAIITARQLNLKRVTEQYEMQVRLDQTKNKIRGRLKENNENVTLS